MTTIQRILVPVDGSAHARRAVDMAAGLARGQGAEILLLHVIRDLSLPQEILTMIASGEVTESRQELLEDSAQIILDNASEQLRAKGISPVRAEFLYGPPAATIVQYAQDQHVDLIVLGAQGLHPHEYQVGGIARKVIDRSPLSCLLVR